MKGFGGIGGTLRYHLDVEDLVQLDNEKIGGEDFDADEDFI